MFLLAINLLVSAFGGLALSSSFPDFNIWFLAPLSIGILYFVLRNKQWWKNSLLAFVFAFSFFIVNLQFISIALNMTGLICLTIFEALYFALLGLIWTYLQKIFIVKQNRFINIIIFSALYVTIEYIRSNWPWGGFSWGSVAYSQTYSPLGKYSFFIGQYGVIFMVVGLGVCLYFLAQFIISLRLIKIITFSCFIGLLVFMGQLLFLFQPTQLNNNLTFAAVQGNINSHKIGTQYTYNSDETFINQIEATEKLINSPNYKTEANHIQVILWPESAVGFDPLNSNNTNSMARLQNLVNQVGKPFIVGSNFLAKQNNQTKHYNSMFLIEPESKGVSQIYSKQHLVPFGEYIPLRHFFEFIDKQNTDRIADFDSSPNSLNIKLNKAILGTRICFEVAIPELINQSVEQGANILFIPSNNSNFGFSSLSAQQLQIDQFRAIENKRSVITVNLSGISGAILPDGTITYKTSLFTTDSFVGQLPLNNQIPPHLFIDWWIITICFIIIMAALVYAIFFKIIKKQLKK
ncbi:MAG: apolipoprotein N-acyltransferase [Bifidobacteriaceae bacterium]|jgi:apolipoprotein N-acyltransferase|nr:apolipoprotein N-acyltransferase [Bifidobacteriaceae bacterium]